METVLARSTVAFLVSAMSVAAAAQTKSVAELQLMNMNELKTEAWGVCVFGAGDVAKYKALEEVSGPSERSIEFRQSALDRAEYLGRIKLVARQKNDGEEPAWIAKMRNSQLDGDFKGCGPHPQATPKKQ